jgi:hypothetical protein
MRRLRALSEAECYARCYLGWEPTVTVLRLGPRLPLVTTTISGEELRRLLEERLDARLAHLVGEPEAEAA